MMILALAGSILNGMSGEVMASDKPWEDWPRTAIVEDLDAGWYVKNHGIFKGYSEFEFRPHEPLKLRHFKMVLDRAKIPNDIPIGAGDEPVYMWYSQVYLPGTSWSADPQSSVTRFRASVMIYRHLMGIKKPIDDAEIVEKINKLFNERPVTWNGATRYSKLIGHEDLIVAYSRHYGVPIWLCLGQGWYETQWYTTGMSLTYNQGWGMKDTNGIWGEIKGLNKGFADYVTIEESIHAYFRLMSSPNRPYKALIDAYLAEPDQAKAWTYIKQALDIYAPAFENDTMKHHRIVHIVKGWCEDRGIE
jgi:hypothetical protein